MRLIKKACIFIMAAFTVNAQADPAQTGEWTKIFGEQYTGVWNADSDYAEDITYDGSGNLYLTGCYDSAGSGGNTFCNFFVGKMDTDGNLAWITEEASASWNNDNYGKEIAIDSQGDIIVSGLNNSRNAYLKESFIAKYDSDGNQIWVQYFGTGTDVATQIALDENDNIYVAGYSSANDPDPTDSTYYKDAALLHFDTNGNLLWKQVYPSPTSDEAMVAYDKAGQRLYTIVSSTDYTARESTLSMRLMRTDGTVWIQKDYSSSSTTMKAHVVSYLSGSLVIAGQAPTKLFDPNEDINQNRPYYVARLSTNTYGANFGSVIWRDRYFVCNGCMTFTDIHIDNFYRPHLTGTYGKNSSANITRGKNLTTWGNDVFYSLYDVYGDRYTVDQMGAVGRDKAGGVTTDEDGNVFISGGVYGDLNGETASGTHSTSADIFVTRNEL